jgi:dTDP-4-amino-4,6-dideoxygalactose transaminase
MEIPFLNFDSMHLPIKSEIMDAFESFYDSNWYVLGEKVKTFEEQFCKFNNVSNTIGVSNGLDALFMSLRILEIGKGDEVIIPSNTYIATAIAVSLVGATPIFVEPLIDTFNINPDLIEAVITPKTKAIMPVHLYGQACQMDKIKSIAEKYNVFIVEDNAQSQGSAYNGVYTGSWGDINATSFYPGKNLGALGDAGAITTNSSDYATKAKVLRNYGSHKKYYNEVIGYNMRLDECQASILSVKLKYIHDWNAQRQTIAKKYFDALNGINGLILPKVADSATHVYHLFVVRTNKRNDLQDYLLKYGISTLIHYPIPIHLQNAYSHLEFKKGSFPIAEILAETNLSLPLWPGITDDQISYISDKIRSFFNK